MHRRRSRENGQGLIEFAIVFPLFVFFLFAVFEVGLGLNRQATLQHAVREGARAGAVLDKDDPAIVARTVGQSQGLLTAGDVAVTYTDLGDEGCAIDVQAHYTFNPKMLGPIVKLLTAGTDPFPTGIKIEPTGSARMERKLTGTCS